ncbi:MAG: hypothetical protein IPK81_12205 [Rhodospirillales bacterium]|nr:MAG: hypothetical protein IPK81_12205 [Rhodospirillales bacterium]
MKRLLAIATASLLAATAQAADPNGRFHIVGAGTVTCQRFLTADDQEKRYVETWWAGYITAINRTTPETYNMTAGASADQVNAMLREHCAANPEALLAVAVHAVAGKLYPNRARQAPN